MSKATGETEHLKDMLVGNILAVSRHDVVKTAVLYGVIGLFHYIFRSQFLLISTNPAAGRGAGAQHPLLGFSVLRIVWICGDFLGGDCGRSAGVLLSVVPSVGAMLFADRIGRRLAIGWTMGTLVSALGVYFSVLLDLPTGRPSSAPLAAC